MTDATARLALPLLQPGQAQKEIYHNEALARLDCAVQASAAALGFDTPPEAPDPGACWILGDAPTGDWIGQPSALAMWTGSGWRFVAPFEGLRVWLGEAEGYALYRGGTWAAGESHGRVIVDGVQIVGPQAAAIADPTGGAVVDAEARSALATILDSMRAHGLIESS